MKIRCVVFIIVMRLYNTYPSIVHLLSLFGGPYT
jgi:hypothetical protein